VKKNDTQSDDFEIPPLEEIAYLVLRICYQSKSKQLSSVRLLSSRVHLHAVVHRKFSLDTE
jgi:hypothetical protein